MAQAQLAPRWQRITRYLLVSKGHFVLCRILRTICCRSSSNPLPADYAVAANHLKGLSVFFCCLICGQTTWKQIHRKPSGHNSVYDCGPVGLIMAQRQWLSWGQVCHDHGLCPWMINMLWLRIWGDAIAICSQVALLIVHFTCPSVFSSSVAVISSFH